jgi:hypothetical protein
LLVYELVFCVVAGPAYLDMKDFPRLELGAHILRNVGIPVNQLNQALKPAMEYFLKQNLRLSIR